MNMTWLPVQPEQIRCDITLDNFLVTSGVLPICWHYFYGTILSVLISNIENVFKFKYSYSQNGLIKGNFFSFEHNIMWIHSGVTVT